MSYAGRSRGAGRGGGYDNVQGRGRGGRGGYEGGRGGYEGGRGGYEGGRGGRGGYEGGRGGRGGYEGGRGGRGGYEGGRGSGQFRDAPRGRGAAPMAQARGPTEMTTNHFKVTIAKNAPPQYKHLVEIINDNDTASRMIFEKRIDILETFLESLDIKPETVAYDGDRLLYSPTPIEQVQTFQLGRGSFRISISKQGSALYLQNMMSRKEGQADRECEQCLDVIFKCASRSKCYPKNQRNFLHEGAQAMRSLEDAAGRAPQAREIRPKKLWMGHCQSSGLSMELATTKEPQCQPTLCLNAAAAVAYDAMCLNDFIDMRLNKAPNKMATGKSFDQRYARDFERQVKGLKFETRHLGGVRKMKLIGLVNKSAVEHKFEHDGRETSVFDYFQDRFGCKLRWPNAPMVQKAPKKAEVYLPLEMVWLSKQTLSHSVSDFLKSLVGAIMTMDPGERFAYIRDSVRSVYGDNDVLKRFGVQLNLEAMRVQSFVLDEPTLLYTQPGSKNLPRPMKISAGKWNLANAAFNESRPIKQWAAISMLGARAADRVRAVLGALVAMANKDLNMQMAPAPKLFDCCDSIEDLELKAEHIKQMKLQGRELDLLFVFVPDQDATTYKAIKSMFDDVCTTQVLTESRTPILNQKDASRAAGHWGNILSKVNEKTGGVNQRLSHAALKDPAVKHFIGNDGNTVIIASAFSHPPALSSTRGARRLQLPSLSALVCSVDRECNRYIHSFRGQVCVRDTINEFAEMVADVLKRRSALTGLPFPKRLIYLRDGVSDTGIDTLIDDEVRSIRKAFAATNSKDPLILAIAVRRAHQTRFFPTGVNDPRSNMPPGTLLYDNLSMPLPYPNFYLISHAGIKGTSHPARYVVITDDFKATDPKLKAMSQASLLQFYAQFIYQLAHLYGRCQRAVSVPAPVYYATLLAERGRLHVSDLVAQAYGVGLTDDDKSTTSHGSGHFVSEELSPDVLEKFTSKMNQRLKDVEAAANPMFYV